MVTLVATIRIASWSQNKRFDDLRSDINARFEALKSNMHRRFNEASARLDRLERIERKLDSHDERIVRLEERTSPVRR
jgi:hypothetical protein